MINSNDKTKSQKISSENDSNLVSSSRPVNIISDPLGKVMAKSVSRIFITGVNPHSYNTYLNNAKAVWRIVVLYLRQTRTRIFSLMQRTISF